MLNIKKFVINLDRRPDRLKEFFDRYGDLGDVERFSAVDGRERVKLGNFSKIENDIYSFLNSPIRKKDGAFGCWMSHVYLWDDLLMSEFDAFVVFEDDAFLVDNFHKKFNEILSVLSDDMSIVYFGGRFKKGFSPRNLESGFWKNFSKKSLNFYYPSKVNYGHDYDRTTHGYIITKRGAELLLKFLNEYISENRDIKTGFLPAVDGFMNMMRVKTSSSDFFPHLAWSPTNYKSDI